MRGSIIILALFAVGVFVGSTLSEGIVQVGDRLSLYVLYVLMFLVGVTIGTEGTLLSQLRGGGFKILLVPAATIMGTLGGSAIMSLFIEERSVTQALMVGSGFGYYSLSSVLITQSSGAALGTVALISNIIREMVTLLFAPLLVKWFSPLGPICCGGATTIDTTLPIISRYSGKDFVFIAIIHGVIVDFSVPILVTLFSSI